MESSTDELCCCCCCNHCCSWCLGICAEKKQDPMSRYAHIQYKLLPQENTGLKRSFVHPQDPAQQNTAPQDMRSVLSVDSHQGHLQSQFIVTQQPLSSGSAVHYSPHHPIPSDVSSSSLSDGSPVPVMGQLHSALSPGDDTIDISESPTGTFNSAYRQSQKKKSSSLKQAANSTTSAASPSRYSAVRHSSSEERDETMASITLVSDSDLTPSLKLSLYYNTEKECLSVCLHSAMGLPHKTSKNYSIVCHLVPEKADILEMKVMGENENPSLEQSFEIADIARDDIRQHKLMICLYDGSTSGKVLGTATLQLERADLFGMMSTVHLDPNVDQSRGELLLSLAYNPKTRTLQGILLKMNNSILASDRTGLSDIYVKVYYVYRGNRTMHWKSTTKQNNVTLIFNEAFQFDLRQAKDIRQTALDVCMMSYDRFSRDEEIGRVPVGEAADHETGQQHWREIAAQPNSRISHWHSFAITTSKKY